MMEPRRDFCYECRKWTEYSLQRDTFQKVINGELKTFTITVAICKECGNEMSPSGLIDKNIEEFKREVLDGTNT